MLTDDLAKANAERQVIELANNKLIKPNNPHAKADYLDSQRREMN